ncbi:MAG: NUDIX domain-containing protein [Planctomycetota bacterium]
MSVPQDGAFDAIKVSKLLAFLLRHRPDTVGLTLHTEGWVEVADLVREINVRQRLPFELSSAQVADVVADSGNGRFELVGARIRARSGHSVPGIRIQREPTELDDFAFAILEPGERESILEAGGLSAGHELRLEEPFHADDDRVLVVEVARANRQGIPFDVGGDRLVAADAVPLKYLLSLRPGFTRQISAGGVLVRGTEPDVEFALIRTKPRKETRRMMLEDLGISPDEEPRDPSDRRQVERRRESASPPSGVERRKSSGRRRRQRRSGRWGPDGRLELPKGKLEPGETPAQAAVREVREELGIADEVEVVEQLAANRYAFRTPEGKAIFKTVHYFLLRCDNPTPDFNPALIEGIVGVEWIRGRDAISEVAFPNLRPILERAWELIHRRGA